MPASIGVNLRVTGHCRQGGRKYMEDFFSVAYQQTEDERDLEYAFFGIYDGHGGPEAAAFAKEHLMETIVRHNYFWSDNDEDVLRAIKDGYIATHYAMWKEQSKWPKLVSGLPSTAGTTASVAFIRRGKIYIGHVGDSGIILGYQEPGCADWKAKPLTKDHKPESYAEMKRIEKCGGKVVTKAGVSRVVWKKPRGCHQGPIRRSTHIDEIPFLAIARSLGDLWSYNSQLDEFIISPVPDCSVIPINTDTFRCLIFGTDGLYNMISAQTAVHIVQQAERHNENAALGDSLNYLWVNPSRCLVDKALERWSTTKNKADNTSVVTLMLDPPGPPRAQVLQNRKRESYPDSGLQIVTRFEGEGEPARSESTGEQTAAETKEEAPEVSRTTDGFRETVVEQDERPSKCEVEARKDILEKIEELDDKFVSKTRESTANLDGATPCSSCRQQTPKPSAAEENIQINEVSSSSSDFFCNPTTADDEPMARRLRNTGKTKPAADTAQRKRTRSESAVEEPKRKKPRARPAEVKVDVTPPRKRSLLRKVLGPQKVSVSVWKKKKEETRLPLSQRNSQFTEMLFAKKAKGEQKASTSQKPKRETRGLTLRSDLKFSPRRLRKRIAKK